MKLFELYKPKIPKKVQMVANHYFQFGFGNYDMLDYKLQELGWHNIGAGSYSHVYSNPVKKYVLKINKHPDSAYDDFVQIIKKYKNKHFPIISNRQEWIVNNKKYYVYLIEKLYEIEKDESKLVSDALDAIANSPNKSLEKFSNRNVQLVGKRYPPSLIEAARILGRLMQSHPNRYTDIHDENIMQRSDGTIVIIDPYCGK